MKERDGFKRKLTASIFGAELTDNIAPPTLLLSMDKCLLQPFSYPKKTLANYLSRTYSQETEKTTYNMKTMLWKTELPTTKLPMNNLRSLNKAIICRKKIFYLLAKWLLLSIGTCTANTSVSSKVSQFHPYKFTKQSWYFQAKQNYFLAMMRASVFNF